VSKEKENRLPKWDAPKGRKVKPKVAGYTIETGQRDVSGNGPHAVEFNRPFSTKPEVFVFLMGCHVGTFEGIASFFVDASDVSEKGFNIIVQQGVPANTITGVRVGWLVIG